MINRQIIPQYHYNDTTGHMLTGYVFRLSSNPLNYEAVRISVHTAGIDEHGQKVTSKGNVLASALKNLRSVDVEVKLDCPLRSIESTDNMSYTIKTAEAHELDKDIMEYESMSEMVESEHVSAPSK